MTVESDIQKPSPGDRVEMFELDVTAQGGSLHRFCSSLKEGATIVWNGNQYPPKPVEASGFEKSGSGKLPQPTFRIADSTGIVSGLVRDHNDILGAKLTRIRTFRKYLDGELGADPTAEFPREVYYIERKANQNRIVVEFTLAALMDMQGKKLPGRLVLKNTCTQTYRVWTGSGFDYANASCPYAGTGYFDEMGNAVTQDLDKCGKRLSDCKLRYPQPATLPTRSFPGVYNVRR